MRPIPPAPPLYRIKEFRGVFTIQKLIKTKVKAVTFWDWFYYGSSHIELNYHTIIDETFKSLNEAEQNLRQIKSETEVKYHNY